MVVITHVLGTAFPEASAAVGRVCNLGSLGVLLFFIVSGTVINASLERSKSFKEFWRHRFWRLYPTYWVSLAIACFLFMLVPSDLNFSMYGNLKDHFWSSFAVNVTMLQIHFKVTEFIPAYWSLGFEIMFYALLSLIFAVKLGKRSHHVLWAISLVVFLTAVIAFVKHRHVGGFQAMLCGYFWLGTWIHRLLKNEVSVKQFAGAWITFHIAVFFAWYENFLLRPGPDLGFGDAKTWAASALVSLFGASCLFLIMFSLRSKSFPKALIALGTVSYSLYLFHGLAIRIGGMIVVATARPILYVVITVFLTIIFTWLAYRFVEVPSMNHIRSFKLKPPAKTP